jgi:hypothetical protein
MTKPVHTRESFQVLCSSRASNLSTQDCFDVDVAELLYWYVIGCILLWRQAILQFVGVPAI